MAYTKTKWVNNSKPAINQDNLNHAEQGIADAHDLIAKETLARQKAIAEHGTAISTLQTSVSAILPASSGTAGQVLTKTANGADWQDVDGLPAGGTAGQVLTKTANGADWQDVDGLPAGGTAGQYLKKKTDADYDYEWANIGCPFPIGYGGFFQTDPNTIYAGTTWAQKKDVFILAAGDTYPAGSTGGEATHTLTVDEMPEHRHASSSYQDGYPNGATSQDKFCTWVNNGARGNNNNPNTGESGPVRTSWVGGSQPHNNMPPYFAMPFWIRTA